MTGRHPFQELTNDFAPDRRRRIDAIKRDLLAQMPLHELRRARALTQQELAEKLKVSQPAVAKWPMAVTPYPNRISNSADGKVNPSQAAMPPPMPARVIPTAMPT